MLMKRQMNILSRRTIDVAAGSIIMAVGIFLLGALHQFPLIENNVGQYLIIMLVPIWLVLLGQFLKSLLNKEYRSNLVHSPIKSFAAGTWIAGTSVTCILMIKHMPGLYFVVPFLIWMNVLSWGSFIIFCTFQFKKIIKKQATKEVHGVILLSTVSTQSIALLLLNYYQNINSSIIVFIICIGSAFYLFSLGLLFIRFNSNYSIHEWKNTDCIIHGALSITGLAMTQSGIFPIQTLMIVWYLAFSLFIVVETIEIIRGIKRIKEYGLKQGILTYHITQWARNFTFGMLYYFTFNLVNRFSEVHPLSFQQSFMICLGWVVFALLIIELLLLINSFRIQK